MRSPDRPDQRFNFVYILRVVDTAGLAAYKFGVASCEWRYVPGVAAADHAARGRMGDLQVGCPFEIVLVDVFDAAAIGGMLGHGGRMGDDGRDAAFFGERAIHRFLNTERLRGEWFAGPRTNALLAALARIGSEGKMRRLGRFCSMIRGDCDGIKEPECTKPEVVAQCKSDASQVADYQSIG
jgi:hypothetical protein